MQMESIELHKVFEMFRKSLEEINFEIQSRLTFTSHVVKSAIRDNEIIFIDFTNFTDMLHEKLAGIFYFVAFVDWIMWLN